MTTKVITRRDLYDLVWSKPMIQLAKDFNLSDNGLRKICKKNDIPTPQMGHWQKIEFGKMIDKIALPKKDNDKSIVITIEESKQSFCSRNPIRNLVAEKIRNNKSLVFKVSDRLNKPDEIVVSTQANIEKRKHEVSYSPIKNTIQTEINFPNIIVSLKNVNRTLRILDCLIKNFKALDYKLELNRDGLNILAYGDKMLLYFREKSNSVETMTSYGWKSRDLIPNGKLAVKVNRFGTFEFVDSEKALVEDQIEKILIKIESEFQTMREMKEMHRLTQQKREEAREIEVADQKRKDNELNKFIQFYNDAHRWKKYLVLKEYFEFLKSNQLETKENIDWIEQKLLWYNPLSNQKDDLMSEVDKEKLNYNKKHF